MRLGVSAKIFLAYAVLLLAFGASSIFTLLYLHSGRQEMSTNQRRRDLQAWVEAAGRALEGYSHAQPSPKGAGSIVSRMAAAGAIPFARDNLSEALNAIDEALAIEKDSLRQAEFQHYRHQVTSLETRLVEALVKDRGADDMTDLVGAFNQLGATMRKRNAAAALELIRDEQRGIEGALMLGGVGLLAAVGAALFMLRTLRPLQVLRLHARQIAGGDYGHRIEVSSRDEIGDLAREFDAMARAVEEREQRLIRSERLATVGRMAAQITHEIRNPLASIGLNVELLGDELGAADVESRKLVAAIGNEVDRLSEITETYLRFVRLPRPKLEREDLGAIATSVMEFARAELSMAGISLELKVAAGLPDVAADENQIRQAILNLVRNAKEAMPAGGRLRVEIQAVNAQVRLSIADSGPGIAAEHLGKIFDPFFSTKDKGTGLGLALVQQIIAEHGGRIEPQRPPQGEGGTVFVVALPALPPGERISAKVAEEPGPSEELEAKLS